MNEKTEKLPVIVVNAVETDASLAVLAARFRQPEKEVLELLKTHCAAAENCPFPKTCDGRCGRFAVSKMPFPWGRMPSWGGEKSMAYPPKLSEAARAKCSAAAKQRWKDPAHRAKIAELTAARRAARAEAEAEAK